MYIAFSNIVRANQLRHRIYVSYSYTEVGFWTMNRTTGAPLTIVGTKRSGEHKSNIRMINFKY